MDYTKEIQERSKKAKLRRLIEQRKRPAPKSPPVPPKRSNVTAAKKKPWSRGYVDARIRLFEGTAKKTKETWKNEKEQGGGTSGTFETSTATETSTSSEQQVSDAVVVMEDNVDPQERTGEVMEALNWVVQAVSVVNEQVETEQAEEEMPQDTQPPSSSVPSNAAVGEVSNPEIPLQERVQVDEEDEEAGNGQMEQMNRRDIEPIEVARSSNDDEAVVVEQVPEEDLNER